MVNFTYEKVALPLLDMLNWLCLSPNGPVAVRACTHSSPFTCRLPACCTQEAKARLSTQPVLIPQLVALLQPGCGEQLQCGVLRLLHNLSFDGVLRQQMMGAGLVPQVGLHRFIAFDSDGR
jgi:hypothetical protein